MGIAPVGTWRYLVEEGVEVIPSLLLGRHILRQKGRLSSVAYKRLLVASWFPLWTFGAA